MEGSSGDRPDQPTRTGGRSLTNVNSQRTGAAESRSVFRGKEVSAGDRGEMRNGVLGRGRRCDYPAVFLLQFVPRFALTPGLDEPALTDLPVRVSRKVRLTPILVSL